MADLMEENTWEHLNMERWKAQKRAAAKARNRAENMLIQRHLDEFNRLHQDCGLEEGVEVKPTPPKWIKTPRPPRTAERLVRPRPRPRMRLAAVPDPETVESLTEHLRLLRNRLYRRELRARRRGERGERSG